MAIFKGAGVAIVTPMKENLEVNYPCLCGFHKAPGACHCRNRLELYEDSSISVTGSRKSRS